MGCPSGCAVNSRCGTAEECATQSIVGSIFLGIFMCCFCSILACFLCGFCAAIKGGGDVHVVEHHSSHHSYHSHRSGSSNSSMGSRRALEPIVGGAGQTPYPNQQYGQP